MPTTRVPAYKCGTDWSGWLNGAHPTVEDGEVKRTVCFSSRLTGCKDTINISVKNCSSYYIYELFSAVQLFSALLQHRLIMLRETYVIIGFIIDVFQGFGVMIFNILVGICAGIVLLMLSLKIIVPMIIGTHDEKKNLFQQTDVSFSQYELSKSRLIQFSVRSNTEIFYSLCQYLSLLLLLFILISQHDVCL